MVCRKQLLHCVARYFGLVEVYVETRQLPGGKRAGGSASKARELLSSRGDSHLSFTASLDGTNFRPILESAAALALPTLSNAVSWKRLYFQPSLSSYSRSVTHDFVFTASYPRARTHPFKHERHDRSSYSSLKASLGTQPHREMLDTTVSFLKCSEIPLRTATRPYLTKNPRRKYFREFPGQRPAGWQRPSRRYSATHTRTQASEMC